MSYLVKGEPFRYKGVQNVEHCTTSEEVINKAGLDWNVIKSKLYVPSTGEEIISNCGMLEVPNNYAICREDTRDPLGVVKGRYNIVQNSEAFRFFDKAVGKDRAIFQTAGCIGKGERIFVSAKLPYDIVVNGDQVKNYLVFTNSHDGSTGVKILFTPIRVICENTLNAAIKNATNYVSFRHTKNVYDNLDVADEILGISRTMTYRTNEYFNSFNKLKFTDSAADEFFAKVILTETEQQKVLNTGHKLEEVTNRLYTAINDGEISTKKVNILTEIQQYYHTGIGQKEIIGTGWGVYNAITGYYSNIDNSEGSKRMDSLLYGDKSNKIKLAGNILYDMAA